MYTCTPVHPRRVHGLTLPCSQHIGSRDSGTEDARCVAVNTTCTTDSPTAYRTSVAVILR